MAESDIDKQELVKAFEKLKALVAELADNDKKVCALCDELFKLGRKYQRADSSDGRSVVISPAGFKEAFEDGYRLGLVDGFKARVGDKDDK